ncbi:MAG TPA: CDP-diacylglycerol--glycerol-3-phosphate 3-phosphatidyltransferase [Candidatus Gallacutalibacter stercoravium]|nr:CDP-diacylglycerol--glycerol-3-phosphate 3-phosphatidyltransferase [Candidatus Gallacutalibacter stercoravium]
MNLPNKLTILRLCLVPVFLIVLLSGFPHHYLVSGLIFGIAAYTDHLDGKLARSRGLITNFGKFMDPVADKVMVVSALVGFVSLGLCNIWLVLIIIAREFLITSLRLVAADNGVVLAANQWGKAKTVSQIVAIVAIFVLQYILELMQLQILPPLTFGGDISSLFLLIGNLLLGIATFFTVLSGVIYLVQNKELFSQTK